MCVHYNPFFTPFKAPEKVRIEAIISHISFLPSHNHSYFSSSSFSICSSNTTLHPISICHLYHNKTWKILGSTVVIWTVLTTNNVKFKQWKLNQGCFQAHGRLKQRDHEFKDTLRNIASLSLAWGTSLFRPCWKRKRKGSREGKGEGKGERENQDT